MFNVTASEFGDQPADPQQSLQNALARLGAVQLQESVDTLPSDRLADTNRAICEALLDGAPRLLTALAPVLVRHAENLHWGKLYADAQRLGVERRLAWVTDNTIWAVERLSSAPTQPRDRRRAALALDLARSSHSFSKDPEDLLGPRPVSEDVVDRTIRTQKTRDAVLRRRSSISRRWAIVSSLQPEDFLEALRAAWNDD